MYDLNRVEDNTPGSEHQYWSQVPTGLPVRYVALPHCRDGETLLYPYEVVVRIERGPVLFVCSALRSQCFSPSATAGFDQAQDHVKGT